MKKSGLVALLVVMLVALVAWDPFELVRGGEARPVGVAGPDPAAGADLAGARAPEAPLLTTPGIEPEGARTQVATPDVAPEDGAIDELAIRGVLLDALTELPIPDAEVEVEQRIHGEYTSLDLAHNKDRRLEGRTRTNAAGRFRIPARADVPFDLTARAPRFATAKRRSVFAGDELELRVGRGAVFMGRVTRAADAEPVAGVTLRAWNEARVEVLRGTTDAGGNFRFDGLTGEIVTLEVECATLASPSWQTLEIVPGVVLQRDFALEDGVAIRGTVTDAETGEPIVGAEVGAGWTFDRPTKTDASGAYVLRGFGGPGVYDVHARASGYGKDQHEYEYDALPDSDARLDFALQPARSAHGRVVAPDGTPLEGVYCAGVASQQLDGLQFTDYESSFSDADGQFAFTSLNPRLKHQLLLRDPGRATLVYEFPANEATLDDVDLGTFIQGPPGSLRGVLRDETGRPIPGHAVVCRGTNADWQRLREGRSSINSSWYTNSRSSRTDSHGRFRFTDLGAGRFVIKASPKGNRDSEVLLAVEVPEGVLVDDLELVLQLGATISGRVVGPDGLPVLEITVRAQAVKPTPSMLNACTARSGSDGSFTLGGLFTDEVLLSCDAGSHNWEHPDTPLASGPIQRVSVGATDVILTVVEATHLRVQVVDGKGMPIPNHLVALLEPGQDRSLEQSVTDDEGRVGFLVRAEGTFDIEIGGYRAVSQGAFESLDASQKVHHRDLPPGDLEHVLTLPW